MLKRLCVALMVLLVPGPGLAQGAAESVQAADSDPRAMVGCKTADHFYLACHAISETPEGQGVGAAAERLAACLQASTDGGAATPEVVLPIRFKGLTPQQVVGSVDCPYNPSDPVDVPGAKPILAHKPTGDDIAKYLDKHFPASVADGAISGSALVECQAIQGAYRNCRTLREYPVGSGIGPAAQRLATLVRLQPLDQANQPVEGRLFRFPFKISFH